MLQYRKSIYYWLLTGCVLVYSMVMIGGVTRLSGSGLSIVKWDLWHGTLPPFNDADWNHVFDLYKQSPQFQKVNYDFTLADFKKIFWWEYIHRLTGRLIGVVFIVPFLYFFVTKKLDRVLFRRLLFIFLLGGLQGALGWFMVASGLQDNPRVSHYRLAAHLITALMVFGYIYWTALEYRRSSSLKASSTENIIPPGFRFSIFLFLLVVLQIIYGAFVAGLKAGHFYNTFPLMGDSFLPDGSFSMTPWFSNLTENIGTVQFIHRLLAYMVTLGFVYLWWKYGRTASDKLRERLIRYLLIIVLIQFLLGVLTLLSSVNIYAALLHQTGAFVLFAAFINYLHVMTGALRTTQQLQGEGL